MTTIENIEHFNDTNQTAITIGTFDGVHLGHQKILKKLIVNAKSAGLKSTLFTFAPHPRVVLQQGTDLKLITTLEEKKKILTELGIDQLIVFPFTKEFSRLSAIEFVRDILVEKLLVKKIIIGYDHHFGRNRTANINDLIEFGALFNFEVEQIPAEEIDAVSISSTKIRNALLEGDIETANSFLGYPFMLTGTIAKGKGLGRKMSFPTANLNINDPYKIIPQNGVYIVESNIEDKKVYGMMNIGFNPTVNGTSKSIEVHFFNLDKDLYGKKIQIGFLSRLRDEQKFDSVNELKIQLEKDKKSALNYVQNRSL